MGADNERLYKEVEELKAAMLPAEDESEETAPLRSRSELVARIQLLETYWRLLSQWLGRLKVNCIG